MVQAVLFDVDGVLVHPWRFRSTLARDHGITPDMTASFFNGPFIRCVEGQADVLEVLPPFLASWGWPGSAAEFVARWLSVENAPDEAVLGVVADIRRCGVPCFVASTQERRRARYLAVEMRFEQLFDGLFFHATLESESPTMVSSRPSLIASDVQGRSCFLSTMRLPTWRAPGRRAGWPSSSGVPTASEPMWPDTQSLLSALANIQMEPTRLTSRAIMSPERTAHLAR